ncbi:enolase C-terminal domain-like protein [Candidatus Binatus sp.]|uniref:enolase C-terminal domain-like protein n=1 Tax=Candidatus Binatus sp. TaxID=2811406 RepID=UPI003C8C8FA8
MARYSEIKIQRLSASAYRIPTDFPESDGTFEWKATTLVLVEATAADHIGIGYTYADGATAKLINDMLAEVVTGRDAMATSANWLAMIRAIRNLGRPGIASMAIAAVDSAMWDLKARILGLPLVTLFGAARDSVAVYGSGGFTSYDNEQLRKQLSGWAQQGIPRVKMKVGREPLRDVERVAAARDAIGPKVELFVDANGAYTRKQALALADRFQELGVSWFEEPVSSDDLEGLHFLRDRVPGGMEIAAGEYGYDLPYFERMLASESVDVLQADATRCAGITGFIQVAALCETRSMPLSAHCGPSLHAHPCCAARPVRHIEYFHDHVRIEHMLFDGVLTPCEGLLKPDLSRPGMGLEFKQSDAKKYEI